MFRSVLACDGDFFALKRLDSIVVSLLIWLDSNIVHGLLSRVVDLFVERL